MKRIILSATLVLALGCAKKAIDIDTLVAQHEELHGKRVKVKAVLWAVLTAGDGNQHAVLGQKAEDDSIPPTRVVAVYRPDEKAPAGEKNTPIELECSVGNIDFSELQLHDCK